MALSGEEVGGGCQAKVFELLTTFKGEEGFISDMGAPMEGGVPMPGKMSQMHYGGFTTGSISASCYHLLSIPPAYS